MMDNGHIGHLIVSTSCTTQNEWTINRTNSWRENSVHSLDKCTTKRKNLIVNRSLTSINS